MNFVFVSPQFPSGYWQFCDRLGWQGVRVLGVGDTPYDQLDQRLRNSLAEYYYTPSLEDYDAVFRAVAFFSYKYGKVDWIESNNEYWLELDARLRTDFNVTTGPGVEEVARLRSKACMKPLYAAAGIPSARQERVTTLAAARRFSLEVGFPLFAKPEFGMGADGARKICNEAELAAFLSPAPRRPYVIEEFVPGDIVSYDAILDSHSNPLLENMEEFPPSMADVAERNLNLAYWCRPRVDPRLRSLGRAAAVSFGLRSRFVHMEFFRLSQSRPGLGEEGDYVGLEVNIRPPGGHTPDMMDFAHSTDVYQIWADMVCHDRRLLPRSGHASYCVYAGRRRGHRYAHSDGEIRARFGDAIRMSGPVPSAIADEMCDYSYTATFPTARARDAFVRYVQRLA